MLDDFQPWPPERAEFYRAAGYWRDRTLGEELKEWTGRYRQRAPRWSGATAG